ncbi:MAG: hypothetical protein HYR63_10885 [Proteobacteria bacterium]|nr:hypothetical protein [Pseudomonadota bacterium]MBI3498272.1 hypothetical protein [Pseudomonadota bacterium]
MVVREIEFGDLPPSPGFVERALAIMGLEYRASVRGPSRLNGKVTGCFVRFESEADADKFLKAWSGFLELRKTGPLAGFGPAFSPVPPKP